MFVFVTWATAKKMRFFEVFDFIWLLIMFGVNEMSFTGETKFDARIMYLDWVGRCGTSGWQGDREQKTLEYLIFWVDFRNKSNYFRRKPLNWLFSKFFGPKHLKHLKHVIPLNTWKYSALNVVKVLHDFMFFKCLMWFNCLTCVECLIL